MVEVLVPPHDRSVPAVRCSSEQSCWAIDRVNEEQNGVCSGKPACC